MTGGGERLATTISRHTMDPNIERERGPGGGAGNAALEGLQAALFSEQRRLWRRILNVPRVVQMAWSGRVGATPADVVLESPRYRLLRYRRATPAAHGPPVVFCYALINRAYILDLQPDKSVVRQYLNHGFDVYLIDWIPPSDADRHLTLEDYVCRYLDQALTFVLRRHGLQSLHVLGYCMGGTMAALYATLQPERVRSLTLLAAPIAFDGHSSLLSLWTRQQHFDVDALIDSHGNCPAWFLQTCFLQMNPVQNFLEKTFAFYEQMDDLRSAANHLALERWLNDNVPVAGETFREFVKKLFQEDQLVRGRLRLGTRPVALERITCPLLLLTADKDHLVPPASTEGIRPHVGSRDVTSMQIGAGHVGLVVSSKAHRSFWPGATRWLAERSTAAPQGDPGRHRHRPANDDPAPRSTRPPTTMTAR